MHMRKNEIKRFSRFNTGQLFSNRKSNCCDIAIFSSEYPSGVLPVVAK